MKKRQPLTQSDADEFQAFLTWLTTTIDTTSTWKHSGVSVIENNTISNDTGNNDTDTDTDIGIDIDTDNKSNINDNETENDNTTTPPTL